MSEERVKVWGVGVRAFHWLLVGSFLTAYATGDGDLGAGETHVFAGYAIAALLAARIAMGFVGGRFARFSDARIAPGAVLGYLRDLAAGRARRHLGHSPAGWAMTFALLVALLLATVSGLLSLAETAGSGPLAGTAPVVGAGAEGRWTELHGTASNAVVALALVHLLGVFGAVAAHGTEVLGAMITGEKAADKEREADPH
ncbi:MAG: cytochrome b/b6 domain-containing protein [Pseudomonadota bacterium]